MKSRIAALVLTAGVALTGCGTAPVLTAAEKVPSLRTSLGTIDSALAHHHDASARRSLNRLITETRAAERAGSLSAASADRIIAAARTLLAQLPGASHPVQDPTPQMTVPTESGSPSPSPSKTPSATPTPTKPKHTVAPPTPTATLTPTPTPTPTPEPSPSATISPAALTTPTP